jgi:hypothetical protein
MFKKYFSKLILMIAIIVSLLNVSVALAAGILPAPTGPKTACTSPNGCGNYSLNDMLTLIVNVANWILGCVGAIALLFFVYGGFVFILSAGSEKKVEEGKTILMNAIIGLVIVFASYLIIQTSMSLLGVEGFTGGKLTGLSNFFSSFSKK